MKELIAHIRRELLILRELKDEYLRKLECLPEGKLKVDEKNGKKYYYHLLEGKATYIGRKQSDLVERLQERRFAEEMLKTAGDDEVCLLRTLAVLQPVSPESIRRKLPKAYISEVSSIITDGEAWAGAPYVKKSSYGRYEDPLQLTMKGDYVRSKSELNIANMMYMKGIPYRYEEVTELCGETIAPDFAVYRESDGKVLFLEHFGMMYNRKYRDDFAWKVHLYIKAGYMPYKDVFFTFEDLDGNIDTQFIDYLMETYFR